ncbi:MAG TPA: PLP-dependent aminotransferase family protein [Nordella sp.]|nr:PLP-dependent aminotransferase family protein [Nordella sp.]
MIDPFHLSLDRSGGAPLTRQIRDGIARAITEGRLRPGARLPSWRDLAAQLGVARGTVRSAYDGLVDAQLIVTSGSAGTHVADYLPAPPRAAGGTKEAQLAGLFDRFSQAPLPFQMGVPAQDEFPFKLWSRLMARAARETALLPASYPDPRGEPELRQEIAAYLAIARGISATASQIFITNGFSGGLGFVIRALALENKTAWMEEPGYPASRKALELAGIHAVPVRTDQEGLIVEDGIAAAPQASFAVVTPGQQAPLGITLSLARRRALLDWAARSASWIIEDDYLSELQLKGRATPALAAVDRMGRVVHMGTFSKTISPALRLGFIVAPLEVAPHFGDVAAVLSPAPGPQIQRAVTLFMREGHYMRHLRRMKRLYASRRDALRAALGGTVAGVEAMAGLGILLRLPEGTDDRRVAQEALKLGMAPVALSSWYKAPRRSDTGLVLSVTTLPEKRLAYFCTELERLIREAVAARGG